MVDLHSLPKGSRPDHAIRNNGPDDLALERFKLRELAEGWPCYRDACEWENFASLFHPNAHVYTTWTGRVPYFKFFEQSKAGMDKGAFIMHRCLGVTTDIEPLERTRALTKMKAQITQRFTLPGYNQQGESVSSVEVDVECDCRFIFFFSKIDGRWGAELVRHWYEKDKMIPIVPGVNPKINMEQLQRYPPGYKCLAYCQELTMGIQVLKDLPGHRRHAGTINGKKHDELYEMAKSWLEGVDVEKLEGLA